MSAARLFTYWGTVLYVDEQERLRHGPHDKVPANAFLISKTVRGRPETYLVCATSLEDAEKSSSLIGYATGQTELVTDAGRPLPIEVIKLERGAVCLRANGKYLSAEGGGSVAMDRQLCNEWEILIPSEHWCFSDAVKSEVSDINWAAVKNHVVDPFTRRLCSRSSATRLLIYGYSKWSHGRVYYDLATHLRPLGVEADILNWQLDHSARIDELKDYYDVFLTSPDGVRTLLDAYEIAPERIVLVSHHEFDLRVLAEQKGGDIFDRFAAYGVVSDALYSASIVRGIRRAPKVVPLGINYDEFHQPVRPSLDVVGYASSMLVETFGIEWKRGRLAEEAAAAAGLQFLVAGSTANQMSFHDMPSFYATVGAILMSSVTESGPLPVLEAAAGGRLVIGTQVGHFPLLACRGGGIIAPMEERPYVRFVAEQLEFYQRDKAAYQDFCYGAQEAARSFDWSKQISAWHELITTRQPN